MRGSNIYQAHKLLQVNTAFYQSKHGAKEAALVAIALGWQKNGPHLDIYSSSNANFYRNVWIDLLRSVRNVFALKNCYHLSTLVIQAYKKRKIAHCLACMSFQVYCAALGKLAVALSLYSMIHGQVYTYDWSKLPQTKKRPPACWRELAEPGPILTISPYHRNPVLDGSRYRESNLV